MSQFQFLPNTYESDLLVSGSCMMMPYLLIISINSSSVVSCGSPKHKGFKLTSTLQDKKKIDVEYHIYFQPLEYSFLNAYYLLIETGVNHCIEL